MAQIWQIDCSFLALLSDSHGLLLVHRYIDSRAENGMTALHLAALMGHLDCVQCLLDAGASMMVRTVDLEMSSTVSVPAGSTPLHLAAQQGNVAIVQAMLQVAHSFNACPTPSGRFRAVCRLVGKSTAPPEVLQSSGCSWVFCHPAGCQVRPLPP